MLPKEYAQLLYEVLENKRTDQQNEILSRFKNILARKKESYLAPAIQREFIKIQVQKSRENITYISSASTLANARRKELAGLFLEPMEFSENLSLLGGIAVRQKDKVYNATLRKRMELLRSSL
ncbi:MAG: F0F1 ATP synthase subunit delta [Candidatus Spechtbacterales bacterium]